MLKKVFGIALIVLGSAVWLYLDCLNRQEKAGAEMLQQSVIEARAEAKKRANVKKNLEEQLTTALNTCNAAAEKARTDYLALLDRMAPRKKGQAVIPQAIVDDSEKIMQAAKAECQGTFNSRMKSGT